MSMPPMSPPAYGPPGTAPMYPPTAKPQTKMPMIAGILLIVSAVIGIAFWAYLSLVATALTAFMPVGGEMFRTLIAVCGGIEIVFAIIGLVGGVMAIRRKMWALGIVGSILGLFTFGFYGLSSILSLVALIILAISRKEF